MRKSVDPALQSRSQTEKGPYMAATPSLLLSKVIQFNPEQGTVDVAIDGANVQGGMLRDVPVFSWSAGTQTGQSYFPTVDLTQPVQTQAGTYDLPLPSGKEDVWALIGFLNGRGNRPVCVGFQQPLESTARSDAVGDAVDLHESGIYEITTKDGILQVGLPDGGLILISTSSTPVDMTTKNANWSPKTTTQKYQINITVQGPVTIDAPEVYLGTSQGGGQAVARVGDSVDTSTGIITGGSSKVFSG